jgi:hypothetical protein
LKSFTDASGKRSALKDRRVVCDNMYIVRRESASIAEDFKRAEGLARTRKAAPLF